jgi:hypothetical protein
MMNKIDSHPATSAATTLTPVDVSEPVVVAALVIGNETVDVIDPADETPNKPPVNASCR